MSDFTFGGADTSEAAEAAKLETARAEFEEAARLKNEAIKMKEELETPESKKTLSEAEALLKEAIEAVPPVVREEPKVELVSKRLTVDDSDLLRLKAELTEIAAGRSLDDIPLSEKKFWDKRQELYSEHTRIQNQATGVVD